MDGEAEKFVGDLLTAEDGFGVGNESRARWWLILTRDDDVE
jgi:hypothetical protein